MNKKVRVTLVRPDYDILEKFSKPVECLALGYLASALRQDDVDVTLLDGMICGWTEEETAKNILNTSPDIIGFTVVLNYFPRNLQRIMQLLRASRFSGPLVVGGHAISFIPERILNTIPEVDAIFSGEGENSIRQYVNAYCNNGNFKTVPGIAFRDENKIIKNPPIRNKDLSIIVPPARDLIPELIRNDGLIAISTSRGCHARCTFCSIPRFYGLHKNKTLAVDDWLSHDVQRVVDEILFLKHEFHLKELLIVDDEFFGGTNYGHERAIQMGQLLKKQGAPINFAISFRAENIDEKALSALQEGGLAHVFIGIEAGDSADLKLYGKGHTVKQNINAVQIVKSLGLSFQPGMMIFNHKSTMKQILENLTFLQTIGELKPILINSSADPHFGTPLLNVLKREDVLKDNGLSLKSAYLDKKVEKAKLIAEYCSNEFFQYMQLICTLQSAVTYEWRRQVPNRTPRTTSLINQFEQSANKTFTDIIWWSFKEIEKNDIQQFEEIFNLTQLKIKAAHQQLKISMGLLTNFLSLQGEKIRYWSQEDLINFERKNNAKFA